MNKEQEYRTYEFEYLSEVKLRDRRSTNCFMSAIDLKVGDCVIIERENRGENHKSQKSSVRNRGMVRVKNAKTENRPYEIEEWYG